jgi:hemolysin III
MNDGDSTARYSPGEEIANSITHGFGTLLAIVGLVALIITASRYGDAWHVTTSSIFGTTLVFSYLASTLYHSIPQVTVKRILRSLDHSAIFLLIAGTYTPFLLVSLRGPWGWSLFGTVWGLAGVGIILKATHFNRVRTLSMILYLAMGWIVIVAIKPLIAVLDSGGLALLVTGGLAYTGGVVFYGWNKLPYNHAIWHLFVLTGSACHFFAIYLHVLPRPL